MGGYRTPGTNGDSSSNPAFDLLRRAEDMGIINPYGESATRRPLGHAKGKTSQLEAPAATRSPGVGANNNLEVGHKLWETKEPIPGNYIDAKVAIEVAYKRSDKRNIKTVKLKPKSGETTNSYELSIDQISHMLGMKADKHEKSILDRIKFTAEENLTKTEKNMDQFDKLMEKLGTTVGPGGGKRSPKKRARVLNGRADKEFTKDIASLLPFLSLGIKYDSSEDAGWWIEYFGINKILEDWGFTDYTASGVDFKVESSAYPFIIQPSIAVKVPEAHALQKSPLAELIGAAPDTSKHQLSLKVKISCQVKWDWFVNLCGRASSFVRARLTDAFIRNPEATTQLLTKLGWVGRFAGKAVFVVSIATAMYDVVRATIEGVKAASAYLEMKELEEVFAEEYRGEVWKYRPAAYGKIFAFYVFHGREPLPKGVPEIEMYRNVADLAGNKSAVERMAWFAWEAIENNANDVMNTQYMRHCKLNQDCFLSDSYRTYLMELFKTEDNLAGQITRTYAQSSQRRHAVPAR